jgi:hypothetical protein
MTETVTPQREYGSKGGMSIFGWAIAIGIGLILFPLLPLILLVILVARLLGSGSERAA